MTAMQCDAAAIYDKRKDNLRFFLDNLPTHACHVQPNFNLCTVCFKINSEIAKGCSVYQRFNQGIVGSKVSDPLHIDLARSIDMERPETETEVPEGLDQEFPLFEFSTPTVHKYVLDDEPEEEVIEAEVMEAEVVEEEPPKPVVKPLPKAPVVEKKPEPKPAPTEAAPAPAPVVKTIKKVKMVAKAPVVEKKPEPAPVTPPVTPPKPEEKKAPEAAKPTEPAAPSKPVVKTIRKVKMVAKAPPSSMGGIEPQPTSAPKPGPIAGIKELPKGGPGDSPAPGPQPLEPHPDVTPPPPGPYPGPSPEPDDDYDEEDMAILKDLEKKAPVKPGPPPLRAEAKPTVSPGPPKPPQSKGSIPPLFATLGKLETKKKPDE
jgi:hypothetical protein